MCFRNKLIFPLRVLQHRQYFDKSGINSPAFIKRKNMAVCNKGEHSSTLLKFIVLLRSGGPSLASNKWSNGERISEKMERKNFRKLEKKMFDLDSTYLFLYNLN